MAHPPQQCGPVTDAPLPLGRRERKKLAIRTAVRKAALRLSLEHGVENVTIEQITAEADIALRTFFNHFSSKEQAIVAAVAEAGEALVAEFRRRPPGESVLRAIREAVLVVMNRDDPAGRDYLETLRLIRRTPSLMQPVVLIAEQEESLAAAIAERIDRTPPDAAGPKAGRRASAASATAPGARRTSTVYPKICAAAALAAARVVTDRWLDSAPDDELPSRTALRKDLDEAFSHLVAGLDLA